MKIKPRPYHTLTRASFIIRFQIGMSPNRQIQVLSIFTTTKREGVKVKEKKMTVTVTDGYIERRIGSETITGFKTKCGMSFMPSATFTKSVTDEKGRPIL
jgi:hypothetical protein